MVAPYQSWCCGLPSRQSILMQQCNFQAWFSFKEICVISTLTSCVGKRRIQSLYFSLWNRNAAYFTLELKCSLFQSVKRSSKKNSNSCKPSLVLRYENNVREIWGRKSIRYIFRLLEAPCIVIVRSSKYLEDEVHWILPLTGAHTKHCRWEANEGSRWKQRHKTLKVMNDLCARSHGFTLYKYTYVYSIKILFCFVFFLTLVHKEIYTVSDLVQNITRDIDRKRQNRIRTTSNTWSSICNHTLQSCWFLSRECRCPPHSGDSRQPATRKSQSLRGTT